MKNGLNLFDLTYRFCLNVRGIQKKIIPWTTNRIKLKAQLIHWFLVFLSFSNCFWSSTDNSLIVRVKKREMEGMRWDDTCLMIYDVVNFTSANRWNVIVQDLPRNENNLILYNISALKDHKHQAIWKQNYYIAADEAIVIFVSVAPVVSDYWAPPTGYTCLGILSSFGIFFFFLSFLYNDKAEHAKMHPAAAQ